MKRLILILLITFSSTFANDWKEVAKEDGIVVYAFEHDESIIPFKAVAKINYPLKKILGVLEDHKRKYLWAPKLKDVKVHTIKESGEYIFSEYYKTPWYSSDREFLLSGHIKKISNDEFILIGKSIDNPMLANHDHIQVDVKTLNVRLSKLGPQQTKIIFEFHGDMGGWIPVWLMNIIQKKWPLRFIQGLRKELENI